MGFNRPQVKAAAQGRHPAGPAQSPLDHSAVLPSPLGRSRRADAAGCPPPSEPRLPCGCRRVGAPALSLCRLCVRRTFLPALLFGPPGRPVLCRADLRVSGLWSEALAGAGDELARSVLRHPSGRSGTAPHPPDLPLHLFVDVAGRSSLVRGALSCQRIRFSAGGSLRRAGLARRQPAESGPHGGLYGIPLLQGAPLRSGLLHPAGQTGVPGRRSPG